MMQNETVFWLSMASLSLFVVSLNSSCLFGRFLSKCLTKRVSVTLIALFYVCLYKI